MSISILVQFISLIQHYFLFQQTSSLVWARFLNTRSVPVYKRKDIWDDVRDTRVWCPYVCVIRIRRLFDRANGHGQFGTHAQRTWKARNFDFFSCLFYWCLFKIKANRKNMKNEQMVWKTSYNARIWNLFTLVMQFGNSRFSHDISRRMHPKSCLETPCGLRYDHIYKTCAFCGGRCG